MTWDYCPKNISVSWLLMVQYSATHMAKDWGLHSNTTHSIFLFLSPNSTQIGWILSYITSVLAVSVYSPQTASIPVCVCVSPSTLPYLLDLALSTYFNVSYCTETFVSSLTCKSLWIKASVIEIRSSDDLYFFWSFRCFHSEQTEALYVLHWGLGDCTGDLTWQSDVSAHPLQQNAGCSFNKIVLLSYYFLALFGL